MPFRTKLFKLMPWTGGVNTSLDPAAISPNQLTRGEDLLFGVNTSRNMRDGINFNWDSSSAGNGTNGETILGLCDFWYGSTGIRTNFLIGLGSSGNLYQWNKINGTRTTIALTSTATAWSTPITRCSFKVMNNSLIYAVDGVGNPPRQYIPRFSSSATDLGTSSSAIGLPQMSILQQWQSRLWGDDKTLLDRLNYSPPGDTQTWGGLGDSGAIDVGVGDGDPVGLTCIFPPFQGNMYVAKWRNLYQVSGLNPTTWQILPVSQGIGCVSQSCAISVDQDDVVFLSSRGIHSLVGTLREGDVEGKYLSRDIQGSINNFWDQSKLKYAQATYLSQINSLAFAVPDTRYAGSGNTAIWLYNIIHKAWYVWPALNCQSLISAFDNDKQRFYIGTSTGRIGKTFNDTNFDISPSGANTAITMTVKTGVIFPEGNPLIINAFKRFTLILAPAGSVNITATIQIENYSPQSLSFQQTGGGNVLGVSFVLGISALGTSSVTDPYSQTIDGYGRSFQVTITQSGQQAAVNIQGIAVEYEPMGPGQETINSR